MDAPSEIADGHPIVVDIEHPIGDELDDASPIRPTRIVAQSSNAVAIVEDDLVLRSALCGALEDAGLSAHPAGTLPNARKLLGVVRPAAMVLDLKLEGVDASPLIAEMRDEGMDVPVVIISADPNLLRRSPRDARTTVLAKPFELDELVAAVLTAVSS